MQVTQLSLVLSLLLTLCLCADVSAQKAGGIESMKLLTPEVGWAATSSRLFWTDDGGAKWKDITPRTKAQTEIVSVFFLNTSAGWALLVENRSTDEPRFDLAATTNAGTNWSLKSVVVPHLNPERTQLAGDGRIDFIDSQHGWMNLSIASSANFRLGALLATADGGKTWEWVEESPGVSGAIRFTTLKDGWLAGGPGDQKLFVTHDGSRSWQEISLPLPVEAQRATRATYDLPTFESEQQGFLPVTYAGAEGSGLSLVLFASVDGGKSWKPDQTLPKLPEIYDGVPFPSAIADSRLITSLVSDQTHLMLNMTQPGGNISSATANTAEHLSSVDQLSFIHVGRGWIVADGKLLSTNDAGLHWRNATPSAAGTTGSKATSHRTGIPADLGDPPSFAPAAAGLSAHLGLHACQAPTTASLQTWWASSPFYDVGVYIGGASRSCSNSNLTAPWVSQVQSYGWGLMPLWAGPQAPCACWPKYPPPQCVPFPHVFHSNPTQAQSDGSAEATSAATAASGLSLAELVIYYDMEPYASSSCGSAVRAFVGGWVSQLHTLGYAETGVYGSPTNAQTDFWNSPNVPENVWVAKTGTNSLSSPTVTIWGLPPLVDSHWAVNSRIRQYLGNHTVKWGTVSLAIDHDIENAQVVRGIWAKTRTYSFTSFDCGYGTYPNAIGGITQTGQVGEIVGYYDDGVGGYHGFSYSGGGCTLIDYPGATRTLAMGVNNAGQIVGVYADQSSRYHGFLNGGAAIDYPGAASTYASGINDDGQVTGYYEPGSGGDFHGFLQSAGQFYSFDNLSGGSTIARAINGITEVVGPDFTSQLTPPQWIAGSFASLSYPGAEYTYANGMNNNGQVVGSYWPAAGGFFPFLYDSNTNAYGTISHTGWLSVQLTGVNDAGQMVGYYEDTQGLRHGLIATPQ
jgi:photosystem II stability/assembly factor-like uncharacterized protein